MPGIDYDINFNHGKSFIIITFVIECAIPSILLFGKAFAASNPTKPYLRNLVVASVPTDLAGTQ